MKAITLFVTVGAVMGYSLAAYSKPLTLAEPVALAQKASVISAS